ncbi:MAG TPA: MerR family transcriptional regulator [Candidatus Lachnoclostridium stercorigallinarum]|uniref:MerR family transcriptional regulator n=1 Tax=Candidatus Lachnoclostridium stercorigallinarum TaxID=2838634 RepID=A0A9D2GIM3_9FIRM|nr:MerR family transcriptional regulator [Candidatus Lachnoclostridium stercorigallinarum]
MYKTYTIGEMARMLGVTAETIRYYERKNIIRPIHNEESGYRYYTTWDLHMIIRARCYLGFGFTIEQTADILESSEKTAGKPDADQRLQGEKPPADCSDESGHVSGQYPGKL